MVFLVLLGVCRGASPGDTLQVASSDGSGSVVGVWWGSSDSASVSGSKRNASPVAVWFHGGMTSSNCKKGLEAGSDLAELLPGFTVISASACKERHWAIPSAVEWIDAALDSVASRRKSPVENVYLLGISDGAIGTFVYSAQGKRKVVARTVISSYGAMLGAAQNLGKMQEFKSGKWLFIQGGSDRLYPSQETVPWIEAFCKTLGKECELKYDPKGEHDWSYWKNSRKDWILKLFKEK